MAVGDLDRLVYPHGYLKEKVMRDRTSHVMQRMALATVLLGLAACSSGGSRDGTDAVRSAGSPPVASIAATTTPPAGPTAPSAVQLVDVAKALALVADPSVVVVDVRTPAEFAEGHIRRADLVDFEAPDFASRIAQLDRSITYLVYCHSSNRSGQATTAMAALGFNKVYNLDGGISAWQEAGAPIDN